nr:MAG TPA: hypothetical protein [Caudoviricetes sp.]
MWIAIRCLVSIVIISIIIFIIMGLSICFGVSFTNVVFGAIVSQFIILTIIVYNLQNN